MQSKKKQLEAELSILKDDNDKLENEHDEKDAEAKEKISLIREILASKGLQDLGEHIISDISKKGFSNFFDVEYRPIPIQLKEFKDDVFTMTQFMSCLGECVGVMEKGLDLEKICKGLRKQMTICGCRTNGTPLETGVRTRNLNNKGDIIEVMASKDTEIAADFKNLGIQFKDALAEQDENLFVKKCADFHFDFTKVHPYTDGNGRTSRVLLSMMLATRNYSMPSLYTTIFEKCDLYERSNAALKGDYTVIEQEVFNRLNKFKDLEIAETQKEKKETLPTRKVTIEDIEKIDKQVDAQDRIEAVEDIKKLDEKNKQLGKEIT